MGNPRREGEGCVRSVEGFEGQDKMSVLELDLNCGAVKE